MKAHRLTIAAAAVIALAAAAFTFLPPAYADVLQAGAHIHYAQLFTAVAVATLRTEHADLLQRASDKLKEVKDGLAPAELKRIEDDHAKLVAEAEAKKRELEAAEAEERRAQVHAWSADDITKIKARGAGFGLRGEVVLEIMTDPKLRSLEAVTDALQDKAASDPKARSNPHIELVSDEGDKLRARVGDAILLRANPGAIVGADAATRERVEAAREFRGMSLLELGRAFMQDGRDLNLRGLSKMQLAEVLLGMRGAGDFGIRAAGTHTTSDFANILANVASKRLRDAYTAAPQTWKPFCRQSNNPDFKTKSVVQLSSAPAFKQVREGAEYSYGGMTDGAESYALVTYGRIVSISRQALINDDLGAFDRLPTMVGRAAATLENTTVYGILTANAAMADTVALFHADHGNLLTGSAIDETNLALAEKAMMEQTSLGNLTEDREKLNIRPGFLVTGTAYKVAAQKILSAVSAVTTAGVNPYAGTMTPIADANITGNKWFVIANPADIDTIEYAYLEGEEGVYIEQRMGFEVDGIQLKGRLDFAAKAIDHRGMAYNPGA
ncbi:phage major capsid protein [Reyranella sp.]|uniref:phage major capsid protein n=1 Tax=Reyranella sp. TaxID=1929291 RepID=UPI003F6FA4E3